MSFRRSSVSTATDDSQTVTLHEWARLTGYDFSTRTYRGDPAEIVAAKPAVHCRVHRGAGARKVA